MAELYNGVPISANDTVQRLGDLRSQGLVELSTQTLTTLGRDVLERWRSLGVDNADGIDEPARAAALLHAALAAKHPTYEVLRDRWQSLIALQPANVWFNNPNALLLYSYLDFTDDATGYNAWDVLKPHLDDQLSVLSMDDWITFAGMLPTPTAWSESRLSALVKRVDPRKHFGRQTFCVALEADRLSRTSPTQLASEIITWTVLVG